MKAISFPSALAFLIAVLGSVAAADDSDLAPLMTVPAEPVLVGDFSKPQPKLDKEIWQSR